MAGSDAGSTEDRETDRARHKTMVYLFSASAGAPSSPALEGHTPSSTRPPIPPAPRSACAEGPQQ